MQIAQRLLKSKRTIEVEFYTIGVQMVKLHCSKQAIKSKTLKSEYYVEKGNPFLESISWFKLSS